MKFENSKMKVSIVAVLIIIVGSLGLYSYANRGTTTQSGEAYLFIKPAFAQSMSTTPTFLDEEAGISLYVNIGRSIDLVVAKTVYKTIENETSNYVLGSLSLPDLPETDEVHCFVHKDGWIVVYYPKADPMSKIIDWTYYSGSTLTKTKLLIGLEKMALAIGATATGAKYYDFQYPYADKWMIIIEETYGTTAGDSFNITIPSVFTIYERSWSLSADISWANFYIDGTYIENVNIGTKHGNLSAAQLSSGVLHNLKVLVSYTNVRGRIAIVLAYKES